MARALQPRPTRAHPRAARVMTVSVALASTALLTAAVLLPSASLADTPDRPTSGPALTPGTRPTTPVTPSPEQAVPDRVASDGALLAGESIAASDARLTMRADGDLTLIRAGTVVWRTGTSEPGASARVTSGGDLQVVADGTVLWSAGAHAPGARLVVKDHGRIYLISPSGSSIWSSPAPTTEKVPAVVSLPLPAPLPVPGRPGDGAGSSPDDGGSTDERVYRTVLTGAPQYADPTSQAAVAARNARAEGRSADAALLDTVASGGAGRWLGPADDTARVRSYVTAAAAAQRTPVLVAYAIPGRDCGSHSSGGFATAAEYRAWVDAVGAGITGARAVVVVEPDALLHLDRCGDPAERLGLIRYAVERFTAAGAEVYLDAASSNSFGWSAAHLRTIALRLRDAGVDRAAGFSVNVSNFQRTEHEVAYGAHVSALLGGPAFVVDTSRNGNGPLAGPNGTVWCNPDGRALGARPATTGTGPHVANLWIKTPGLSDGACNGGPAAGRFWEQFALGLAARAAG